MKYTEYQLADFLSDDFFVRWVTRPTPESQRFWQSWLDKNPEKAPLVAKAKEMIRMTRYRHQYEATDDEYMEVLEKIYMGQPSRRRDNAAGSLFIRRIAAAAAVLLLLATGWRWAGLPWANRSTGLTANTTVQVVQRAGMGQQLSLLLPDGSKVRLNSGSEIAYAAAFGENQRSLTLTGEAFFDVVPDPDRPFVIRTGELTTTVLGTSFNVSAYPNQEEVQVAVVTGRVQINKNSEVEKVLSPNEMLTYHRTGDIIVEAGIDDAVAWKDGVLVFRETPVQEVFSRLERWYGVDFVVADSSRLTGNYNGRFDNETIDSVLEGLAFSLRLEFERNQQRIIVLNK